MRFILALFIGTFSLYLVSASDSISTFTFTDDVDTKLWFTDSLKVFIDQEARYSIEDLLHSSNLKFDRFDKNQQLQAPFVLWSKLQLTNATSKSRDGYLNFLTFIDSIWMYTVKNGKVLDKTFTGIALKPSEKSLYTNLNNIPISLYAGETKTFYFKIRCNKLLASPSLLTRLRYSPRDLLIQNLFVTYVIQSFYAGVMVLFGLVSVFMFFMFRERVFVYFSLLMFSFAAYFLMLYDLNDLFLNLRKFSRARPELHYVITVIVLSLSFFITHFINLRDRKPKIYLVYLIYSLFVAFFAHVGKLFSVDPVWITQTNNVVAIPWIILTMVLVVWSARKKDKSSIILLLSIGILFLGSLLFSLSILGVLPTNLWTQYAFQIGTMLFSGTLFYGLFDKINTIKAEKLRFEELDKMKSRFFANISHEFRTPLTLVMGPLNQIMDKTNDAGDRNLLKMAHRNASRLLQLINQILDLSKLEAGKMELRTEALNFAILLKGIVMSFESLAARKNISLHFVTQKEEIPLYVDKDKIEKIFYNLLSNAFKFSKKNGEVAVMITDHKKHIEVIVRDNGVGISSDRLPKIFNRYFQTNHKDVHEQVGTGIGLALVKELIHLHSGTISVISKLNAGTSFTIHFQKGSMHLKASEIVTESATKINEASDLTRMDHTENDANHSSIEMYPDSFENNTDETEVPMVLIIEDNQDVRAYIRQYLDGTFQILEAINGQDGIEKAFEHMPDLIISDVMMPEKDGYEVCAILKKDQRTSHIPVILLTAKAASEEKLKGLETGADDYLVKPFDTRELLVRVRNLIELRQQLKKRFSDATIMEPQSGGNNKVDKAFLKKIISIIDSNLANEQFGVEMLAFEVGMSKGHLNRKLKALSDQSANKIIQSYRLQKAYQMLLHKAGNVSEIALKTGFSSTAYFVKCFGDKYGTTPGVLLVE